MKLRVHPGSRFLQQEDGRPFFYLADTAWELLHRATLAEADEYFADRAAKGFNVVQTVALAELDGVGTPNALGDLPLLERDVTRPHEPYWRHVDALLAAANRHGLTVALLPTWGSHWCSPLEQGGLFHQENARAYGRWLGRRYRETGLIWVLGGDRAIETPEQAAIIRAMAEGLAEGDGGAHLRTFHPRGNMSSSQLVHAEPWLDFHMIQSGHSRARDNGAMISRDHALMPRRPVLDGEPGYEDHGDEFDPHHGWLDAHDVRRSCYVSLFSGACGFTYGCHPIWQWWAEGRAPITWVRRDWRAALALPGSAQVGHARRLLESRPYFGRVPDQSFVIQAPAALHPMDRPRATRDVGGAYALVYLPLGQWVDLNLARIGSADTWRVSWFDPRTGASTDAGRVPTATHATFRPPPPAPDGRDWVLVLDAA
jgi:hypothetical protein